MLFPPARSLIRKYIYKPGQGPDREVAAKDFIELRGVAWPDVDSKPSKLATVRARYWGSMYYCKCSAAATCAIPGRRYYKC